MGRVRWGGAGAVGLAALALWGCRDRAREVQERHDLQGIVTQMKPAVEKAVGLTFRRDPLVLRRTRDQVREYVVHRFDEELPKDELAGVQASYRLFGLLPDTLDLRRTMIDLLTEQVAGYYDPDSNALFVPTDADPQLVRMTVSHELTHALQDQYLSLDSLLQQKRQNDRRSAAQAILEGQATLAQILVLMPEQSKQDQIPSFWETRKAFRTQMSQMKEFSGAPLWLRETLIFPYLSGADFVRWFRNGHPGEQPYGRAMPTSTEQILHPDRYAAGDAPVSLAFQPTSAAIGSPRYEDDLGEFETRLLFEQLLDDTAEVQAPGLATGWGGDRYAVFGPGRDVLVWYVVWDNALGADQFAAGLKRAWARRRTGGPADRRWRVERVTIDGRPGVRLIDALSRWEGWRQVPAVRIVK